MKIEKLDLPESVVGFLKSQGYAKLYPPQADSVKSGLLDGQSLLVSAPTASGKTLIAMLAILGYLSKNTGKVIYLSPLRALASEKFLEFKKLERLSIGNTIKAAISTGDFENIEKNLGKSNILVLTNEKMDSIIRHGTQWIDEIGLVIADEIHLIGDESRGPALEMILTQLKLLEPRPQIVGLSATITNSDDLASWLGCKLVKNDWRPVPLSEGVCDAGRVTMNDGKTFEVARSIRGTPIDLAVQSVQDGGQSLVFAETRARSRSLATKAADAVYPMLKTEDIKKLAGTSRKILSQNEHTELVKTLALLVKKGVAFHHAGLNQNCRTAIETEFRNGTIKLLSSTPTLAAGVNLPARRVVISNVNRYNAKVGANRPISILEYKQLCGRAGRPQYDKYGESIIVGNGNAEALIDYYINGEPESIASKITEDRSLRTHVLGVVVANPGIKKEEILTFFLQIRNKDYETASLLIENNSAEMLEPISEYDCSRSLLALHSWITESSELSLSDSLDIESGDMHRMAETANWLSYCLREISKHVERADLLGELGDLRYRIVYGIREDLLDLVRVKGIGRVRARILYGHGIKTVDDLKRIPVNKLAEIDKIGSTIADNIKSELRRIR